MKRHRNNAYAYQPYAPFVKHPSPLRDAAHCLSSTRHGRIVSKMVTTSLPRFSRRAMLSTIALSAICPAFSVGNAEEYDAMRTKRYLDTGRPESTRVGIPTFDSKRKTFEVNDLLQGQDIKIGTGPEVGKGTLVRAQWVISLSDGSIVEDTTTSGSVVFRVGAGQVASGIENSVLGMKSGGSRVVRGPSSTFFSDITSGERTLVPKGSEVYMDILVQQLDPYARK